MQIKYLLISLIGLMMASCQSGPSTEDQLETLRNQITAHLSEVQGDFAVAFRSLGSDTLSLMINEKESFHAASTMKTPVMIELYKQVALGNISLDDSITVVNEFKSIVDGSPFSMDLSVDSQEGLYGKIGQKSTYKALNFQMITMSSNLATNILIDKLDAKKVTQTMRDLGAKDIEVLRGVEDLKAYEQGLSNTTTAYDLMVIMEAIAAGKAVSKEASAAMFEVLKAQHFNEIIPGLLPENVTVAHKTGSITGVRHDSGIVELPSGERYVLVLLSKNLKAPEKGIQVMAQISKLIYKFVENKEG
ncbi:serine hydrolase [Echinicola vietnamensis]|uniref:beta-lactamase n=1 Tax=Echinicola vietnamensis (strain DSM 17526 / LMG 23754 / KMM 6221) TaxID=926556 RepID=L0G3T4_ECHVK|nr:serine hydrolase [Echinicola vietnamensis]AGA80187.1 beta-lactamase class A [Echinicola vietnamensis DSM 17526]